MTHDLEKYGLLALGVIIVLILLIALSDLLDGKGPGLKRIRVEDASGGAVGVGEGMGADGPVVFIHEARSERASPGDFYFLEPPVSCPGSPAGQRRVSASTSAATETARKEARIHRVRKGESLSAISRRYYGTSGRWRLIVEANPGVDARKLEVGRRLVIPSLPEARENPGGEKRAKTAGKTRPALLLRYRVRKGDTLGKIAKRFYGSEGAWKKILEANRPVIPDPKQLKIGMLLEIPR